MTSSAPLPPPARRRAWGPWLVVAGLLAILAWLVFSGLSNALVYYLTPTELAAPRRGWSARRSGWAAWSCPAA